MKLSHKLVLGSLVPSSLIWLVGFYAVSVSRRSLEQSIERRCQILASEIMDEVDATIHDEIDEWRAQAADPVVQRTLRASNEEFEKIPDVRAHIDARDREWVAAPKAAPSPLMAALAANEMSAALKSKAAAEKRHKGCDVFAEVFATNRYGANAAQTGRTTDYRQDDEQWWQRARKDGLCVTDVEYDDSAGVCSTNICLRIDDDNGEFIGVMKVVLNIARVFALLEARQSGLYAGREQPRDYRLVLLTADGRVIYPPGDPPSALRDGSEHLLGRDSSPPGPVQTFRRRDERRGEILATCAVSRGHDEYEGLGWKLVVEQPVRQVLRPVRSLRTSILILTSAGSRGDAGRCRQLGVAGYLTKPIKQSDLLDAIVSALAGARPPGEVVTRHWIRQARGRLDILLAEDNAVNRALATRMLEKRGHRVVAVADGRQAVEALGAGPFDLVLMDCQMPVMDGYEATALIRAKQTAAGARVPIVAMTAHAMKGDRQRCLAAGMDDYIAKPIDHERLFEVVESLAARSAGAAATEDALLD